VSAGSTNRTVLVVDDDRGVRELLTRSLSFEGFDVMEAANGQDALIQLRTGRRPGVIVLDLRMPVMDGWAFRVAQRADPRIARIPVVILSGADAHRFQEIEAVAALEKPVSLSQLADCLHRIVEHQ
jgi:Response regulator containing CheY-like receiver, AAA-type ATPase, and DNA-binding domains